MKVEFFESDSGCQITLEPETLKEATELSRATLNVKAVPPQVRIFLNRDGSQSFSLWMESVKPIARRTSITNKK